jgi:hypothetical protein
MTDDILDMSKAEIEENSREERRAYEAMQAQDEWDIDKG